MSRNCRLTEIAGIPRAQGHEHDSILAQLLAHPERNGLPEAECRRIAKSAEQWPAGTPRAERQATSRLPPIDEFCRHRAMTPEGLSRVGAIAHKRLAGFGKYDYERVIEFPLMLGSEAVSASIRRSNNTPVFRDVKSASRPGAKRTGVFRTDFASGSDLPVLLCEGETCCAALASYHEGEIIGTPSARPSRESLAEIARLVSGRHVVLIPDAGEESSDGWLERIAATCVAARASSVWFLPHIGTGSTKDIEDRLRVVPPEERAAWLSARLSEACRWQSPTAPAGSKPTVLAGAGPDILVLTEQEFAALPAGPAPKPRAQASLTREEILAGAGDRGRGPAARGRHPHRGASAAE